MTRHGQYVMLTQLHESLEVDQELQSQKVVQTCSRTFLALPQSTDIFRTTDSSAKLWIDISISSESPEDRVLV